MTGPYDDIINLPHPTSVKHPRMPLSDRAAQFAPLRPCQVTALPLQKRHG